jgi:large subunit ribosomal protein L40e
MPSNETATERTLNKQICMRCNARNAPKAKRCRKCGYARLRPKATERRAA